jgi:hypothetical protein
MTPYQMLSWRRKRPLREHAVFTMLRGIGLTPQMYLAPNPPGPVPGNLFSQTQIELKPNSYVCGFEIQNQQPAGCQLQIVDLGTNTPFFSGPISSLSLVQSAPVAGISFDPIWLPKPRLVLTPGQLQVQIRNLSANANTIEFILFVAEPA